MSKIIDKLESIERKADALDDKVKTVAAQRKTGYLGNAPFARKGENIMGSRGFQFGKLMGATGQNPNIYPEEAKIELEFCDRFTKKMIAAGYRTESARGYLVPIAPEFFPADLVSDSEYYEMKSLLDAGVYGAQDDWRNRMGSKTAASPALSFVDQSVGGSFVPPPVFGPPIELLRNHEVLMNAGATVVPLGPTGKIVFPRLTQATQGGWSPENTAMTPTQPNTGQLILSAKKVMSVVVLPGELLRFGSPATEAIVRNDMFKTIALLADKGFLDGPGSNQQPLGLATMGASANNAYGLAIVTPTTANQLAPQDVYAFLSGIEENNGEATAWIMRPKMKYAFSQARFTPYGGGTSAGTFTFDLTRSMEDAGHQSLAGLKIVSSVQVSNTRGSGAQTYVIALNAPDYYIGMFGAIEFTQTDQGYNLISSDQVAVRALLSCDGAPRHPGQVAFCDSLNFTVGP